VNRQFRPAPPPKSEAATLPVGELIKKYGAKRVAMMVASMLAMAGFFGAFFWVYDDYMSARFGPSSLVPALVSFTLLVGLGVAKGIVDPEQQIALEDEGLLVNGKYLPKESVVSAYVLKNPERLVIRHADETLEVPLERYTEADRAAIPEAIEAWKKG
jgi:hypothetical protein